MRYVSGTAEQRRGNGVKEVVVLPLSSILAALRPRSGFGRFIPPQSTLGRARGPGDVRSQKGRKEERKKGKAMTRGRDTRSRQIHRITSRSSAKDSVTGLSWAPSEQVSLPRVGVDRARVLRDRRRRKEGSSGRWRSDAWTCVQEKRG